MAETIRDHSLTEGSFWAGDENNLIGGLLLAVFNRRTGYQISIHPDIQQSFLKYGIICYEDLLKNIFRKMAF